MFNVGFNNVQMKALRDLDVHISYTCYCGYVQVIGIIAPQTTTRLYAGESSLAHINIIDKWYDSANDNLYSLTTCL